MYKRLLSIPLIVGLIIVFSCKSMSTNNEVKSDTSENKIELKYKKIPNRIKINVDVEEEDITEQKNHERFLNRIKTMNPQDKISSILDELLNKEFKLHVVTSEADIQYVSTHSRLHKILFDTKLTQLATDFLKGNKAFRINSLIEDKIKELKEKYASNNNFIVDDIQEEIRILGTLSLVLYHPKKEEVENYFLRRMAQKSKILSWKNYTHLTFIYQDLYRYMPIKTKLNNLNAFSREFFFFKTSRLIFEDQNTELNFILPNRLEDDAVSLYINDKKLMENTPIGEIDKVIRRTNHIKINDSDLKFNEQDSEKFLELEQLTSGKFPEKELQFFEEEKALLLQSNPKTLTNLDKKLISFQRSKGNQLLFIRAFEPFVSLHYNPASIENLSSAFSLPIAEIPSKINFTIDYASEKEIVTDPAYMVLNAKQNCLFIPHVKMVDVVCIHIRKGRGIFEPL